MANHDKPVKFIVPDDVIEVTTWGYILKLLEVNLQPTINILRNVNASLLQIDTKLAELIPDEE